MVRDPGEWWRSLPAGPCTEQDEAILSAHRDGIVSHDWFVLELGELSLLVSERVATVAGRRLRYSPRCQQRVADWLDAHLLTPAIVDAIWRTADVRLTPHTLGDGHGGPAPDMCRVSAWSRHDAAVDAELRGRPGLVASECKDWVLAIGLWDKWRLGKKAANYGLHDQRGQPVEPLLYGHNLVHGGDYSQGGRWVAADCALRGSPVRFSDVLTGLHGPEAARLIGGPLPGARQPGVTFEVRP